MDDKNNLWIVEDPKTLMLHWEELPFTTETSIRWRGILFHIKITAYEIRYGSTRVITFLYNNQYYNVGLTKWKYSGGGHGVYPPDIATATHHLKIRSGLNFLTLKDERSNESCDENAIEESPFEILKTPDNIFIDHPVSKKTEVIQEEIKINKNEVPLYEYNGLNVNINSYAYFDKDDLVIDFCKLGGNYDDEYFIYVRDQQLKKLFREFEIYSKNRAELLIVLMNAFKGKDCFEKVQDFLKLKEISFDCRVWR